MSHAHIASLSELADQVAEQGWVVTEPVVEPELIEQAIQETAHLPAAAGIRNLLDHAAWARTMARHPAVRAIPESMLGAQCFVARAILFDKTPDCNWKVPWHQDLTIAVRERRDMLGFGPWSVKEGVHHVQPPAEVLARMVTVRVHLDECGVDNGPVRVIPGSHRHGALAPSAAENLRQQTPEATCAVAKGGILAFAPLVLHASSPAKLPCRRRVAHFEFAVDDLPGGLQWETQWR
ncbi:MAG: phytanoyl-CoA dioxygenase family protein [Phycisphaerales bacterium]